MKLQREYFSGEKDGFFGAYFPNPKQTDRCMIALLGDDIDDYMARTGAKWLMQHGCNVMTMTPSKMDERLKTFAGFGWSHSEKAICQRKWQCPTL